MAWTADETGERFPLARAKTNSRTVPRCSFAAVFRVAEARGRTSKGKLANGSPHRNSRTVPPTLAGCRSLPLYAGVRGLHLHVGANDLLGRIGAQKQLPNRPNDAGRPARLANVARLAQSFVVGP